MSLLKPILITGTTLPDVWHQAVYRCVELGKNFKIDKGSFENQERREFDWITVHVTHPGEMPLIPQLSEASPYPNPVEDDYLDDYMPYLMTGEEKEGESYTYGQRICKAQLDGESFFWKEKKFEKILQQDKGFWDPDNGIIWEDEDGDYVNQMEALIYIYKKFGHRNNQMIMQVGQPTDNTLLDPPCLRHIDTRIQDGKLHFFPYFRSWDLFGGFPANLAALELMKQYMSAAIGVGNGEMICSSKGLHIYDYVFEIAEAIRGRSMEEFINEVDANS